MSIPSEPDKDRVMIERLCGSFNKIKEYATNTKSFAEAHKLSISPMDDHEFGLYMKVLGEAKGVVSSYNKELKNLEKLPKHLYDSLSDLTPIQIGYSYDDHSIEWVMEGLTNIIVSSQAAVSGLESQVRTIYGRESIEASKLEGEIRELEIPHKLLYTHLIDSIQSFKVDSYIGAVLTASKVASYVLDKIELDEQGNNAVKGLEKSPNYDEAKIKIDEERVRILVEKKLIRSSDKEHYIRGIRKLRNAYTHNIEFFPKDSSEALSFLTDAISLAKIHMKLHSTDTSSSVNSS